MNSLCVERLFKKVCIALLLFPLNFSLLDHAQSQQELIITVADSSWENSIFFNSAFLANPEVVSQTLQEKEGFTAISFNSSDGIPLCGLFKQVVDARATIIFCAGFFPGRKEGIATFATMAPTDCNMLFFDARGHGCSQGPFWSTLTEYGIHEYKDICGAIAWVHEHTHKPIIIHGLCAGAFHTIKAVNALMQEKNDYHIQALICDSSICSIPSAAIIPLLHIRDKFLPSLWKKWYTNDTKQSVKQRWLYKISWYAAACVLYPAHWYFKKQFAHQEHEGAICPLITQIQCPILFIHGARDTFSPLQSIEKIIAQTQKPVRCILDESDHALLHLKHKHEYCTALKNFIARCLT